MHHSQTLALLGFLLLIFHAGNALNCSKPPKVIDVNQSGHGGSLKTIQSAIDSIPTPNTEWTHIRISAGTYVEKIRIIIPRSCIFMEGAGSSSTIVQWSDHTAPTLDSSADDIVAKNIAFENTYNHPPVALASTKNGTLGALTPALAASVVGDRVAFINCSFKGVQDTLSDSKGRHYFHHCYIQGGADFIFGNGQSIYENCVINFTMGPDGPRMDGVITAQNRESINSPSGFVFKKCYITGSGGKVQLGRAYGPFSRVIFAYSNMSDAIRPEGWSAWGYAGHEANFTYVEEHNYGPGADKSKRVKWMKHMDSNELNTFLSLSYIDNEGWIANLPIS